MIVAGDKVYAGTGDSFELRGYDLGGKLERLVRRRHVPVLVTQSDISAFIAKQMEEFGPGQESMKERARLRRSDRSCCLRPLPQFRSARASSSVSGRTPTPWSMFACTG